MNDGIVNTTGVQMLGNAIKLIQEEIKMDTGIMRMNTKNSKSKLTRTIIVTQTLP